MSCGSKEGKELTVEVLELAHLAKAGALRSLRAHRRGRLLQNTARCTLMHGGLAKCTSEATQAGQSGSWSLSSASSQLASARALDQCLQSISSTLVVCLCDLITGRASLSDDLERPICARFSPLRGALLHIDCIVCMVCVKAAASLLPTSR